MLSLLSYALIAFVLLVFIGMAAIDLFGMIKKERKKTYKDKSYKPKTLVIVPCKGMDIGLYENLVSLTHQDYKNFEVVAVLDTEEDAAIKPVKKAGIRYLLSKSDCTRCSGKVRAISTALGKLRNYDVYVIADSDISVSNTWLESIIKPLSDGKVGLSTMYPYFKNIGGFWSRVKSVWGMVGEGLMKNDLTKFGWGGSLAFRKELLDKKSFEFLKNSVYSISDDVCLTMIAKKKKLEIAYVDSAQPVVKTKDDLGQFWEWANRQTALSILGNRKNLYLGIPFYLGEAILILSGISFSIFLSPIFLLLLLHYAKSLVLTFHRSKDKGIILVPITLMIPFLYLVNLVIASGMKKITWRGSVYCIRNEVLSTNSGDL